jgi:hypothetical protein
MQQKTEIVEEKPFEIPKLKKVAVKPKEEPKEEPAPKKKTKVAVTKKPKYEELPEIPDYERPELEKYNKFEDELREAEAKKQQVTAGLKPQQGVESSVAEPQTAMKNGVAKPEKPQVEEEDPRKLKMGRGSIPDDKNNDEKVKLKKVPQAEV